jgi:hypothetical protein
MHTAVRKHGKDGLGRKQEARAKREANKRKREACATEEQKSLGVLVSSKEVVRGIISYQVNALRLLRQSR